MAQERLLIDYDTVHSLTAINHITDRRGNIFVLSALQGFDSGQGTSIHGAGTFGSVLTKVDENRSVLWSRLYNLSCKNGWYPATELLAWNDRILIPYNVNIGSKPCEPRGSYMPGFKLEYLLIDTVEGNIADDKVFWDDSCGSHHLIRTHKLKNELHIFYHDDKRIRRKTLDASLKVIDDEVLPFNSTPYDWDVFLDTFTSTYLVGTKDGIQLYNQHFDYRSTLVLPDLRAHKGTIRFDIAIDKDKYAVAHTSIYDNKMQSSISILSRRGNVLASAQQEHRTSSLVLGQDGSIWTLSQNYWALTKDKKKPVEIKRMNSSLRVELQDSIGDPFYHSSSMSAFNKGEMLIVGTSYTSAAANYPNKRRNSAFVESYHFEPKQKSCGSIALLPNPTHSVINVTGWNFEPDTKVVIRNTAGQTLYNATLDANSSTLRLPQLPAGTYLVTLQGQHKRCVKKLTIN